MARLNADNIQRARDLIALYPEPRSALIPILHVVQEQDGWLTPDGMAHAAELLELTPAEVLGTASFYDMFFTHPVGKYLVSVCTNIACLLNGGYELLEHAEATLGVKPGGTTPDGQFTLEEVECIALCGNAPCLAVNWRFFGDVTNESFDGLVDDLRADRRADEVPPHGTLSRVRRSVGLVAAAAPSGASAPAVETGAAATSDAPAPAERTERAGEAQPASAAAVASAAKEAAEVQDPPESDTAGGTDATGSDAG